LIRQLPNLVSVLRLCLAPFVLRAIWNHEYEWALAWLFFAAFTDILDGFLARRLGVVSRSGAYLDPIADKVLLSGTYFVLGYDRVIPLWLTAIVFGRDALMLLFIGAAMTFTTIRNFPPTKWGKLSTAVQILTAFLILLNGVVPFGANERLIRTVLVLMTALATTWSAIDYARIGIGMLHRPRSAETPN
jgi:cardiolipin synthase